MPKYGLIACFSPVTATDIGENKFNEYGSAKTGSWKMEKYRGFGELKLVIPGIGKKRSSGR